MDDPPVRSTILLGDAEKALVYRSNRRRAAALISGGTALALGIALSGSVGPAAGATQAPLAVTYNALLDFTPHFTTPDHPAPGSDLVDPRTSTPAPKCVSATHPYPVLLLEGTGANQAANFWALSPLLKDNGYCVYTVNYGTVSGTSDVEAIGDIPTSAQQVAVTVDKILAATGAAKIDLVGHSQGGGVTPRWYLKFDGGAAKVDKLIGLAPSNHGTSLDGLVNLGNALGVLGAANSLFEGPAYVQQETGSTINTTLDAGGDTVPGVSYTTIVSKYDEVVTPYTQQFLTAGPGATVNNILLQNVCSQDHGEHLSAAYDEIALQEVLNALDPAHAVTPKCVFITPIVGG